MRIHQSLPAIVILTLTFVATFPFPSAPTPLHAAANTSAANLLFIENVGQFDSGARYQVRGVGGTLWLAQDALWLTVLEPTPEPSAIPTRGVNLRLSFPGANPTPRIEPFDPLATTISYFTGNDPAKWHADVPVWGGVRYVDLYPGVDLELREANGQLQLRLIAGTAEDAAQVRLNIEGAEAINLTDGAIHVQSAIGTLNLPLLELVTTDGQAISTTIAPNIVDTEILMPFGTPTPQPSASFGSGLIFSTFLGGISIDQAWALAVDSTDNVYLTGITNSTNFPTTPGTFDPTANGGSEIFVSKMSADGSSLLYSTYLGGDTYEISRSLGVDSSGNAYITGDTQSANFPSTAGAFDTFYNGKRDAFVTKMNANGTALVYSTFLGGTDMDAGSELTIDETGRVYVTGKTHSSNYPTTPGALDSTYNETGDIFITALNETGSTLNFSTYIGGENVDDSWGIFLDGGNVYITGSTTSLNFPFTPDAYDTTYNGNGDLFVTKINAGGSTLIYSTYLGGKNMEDGSTIIVDNIGNAYVTGYTFSSDFPTSSDAYDTSHNGNGDIFVTIVNSSGSDLVYSTFLGGSSNEDADDIVMDGAGNLYLVGYTSSPDFPTTVGAYDTTLSGSTDGFISKLALNGNFLDYSSFFGGYFTDSISAATLDTMGMLLLTGTTTSSNFPVTLSVYDISFNGIQDGFVSKIEAGSLPPTPTPTATVPPTNNQRLYLPLIWVDE